MVGIFPYAHRRPEAAAPLLAAADFVSPCKQHQGAQQCSRRPFSVGVQLFWLVGSILEASVWTLDCIVSCVAWTLIYKIKERGPTAVRWRGGGRI